jgi:hypothetical protein
MCIGVSAKYSSFIFFYLFGSSSSIFSFKKAKKRGRYGASLQGFIN